jgi:diaminohydroxyphosphoribosylaminopyrimidine deaminase/5-amino-6-(5-phosphoribosylamino)uracil reductase
VCTDVPVTPAAVLSALAARESNDVLVEAGPRLTGAFLQAGLVDELIVYLAPKLLGDAAIDGFDLPSPATLADCRGFELADSRRVGADLRLTLLPQEEQAETARP